MRSGWTPTRAANRPATLLDRLRCSSDARLWASLDCVTISLPAPRHFPNLPPDFTRAHGGAWRYYTRRGQGRLRVLEPSQGESWTNATAGDPATACAAGGGERLAGDRQAGVRPALFLAPRR